MEDYIERYGANFRKLVDSHVTKKEFEFDTILLMPTAKSYSLLVEQASIEIKPRIMNYLKNKWSEGTIKNMSFFAMAAAIYARSVSDPPYEIDVGKVLLRTVASCNLRCAYRTKTGGGCRIAAGKEEHHLPRCIKRPRDISVIWQCLKKYIATGKAMSAKDAPSIDEAKREQEAMSVRVELDHDYSPIASC
jgi:hypothetical protein